MLLVKIAYGLLALTLTSQFEEYEAETSYLSSLYIKELKYEVSDS